MADSFDPYYTWLGIPPEEQPPDHYRLLAVRRFENNAEVLTNACHSREALVHSFESGPRAAEAQRLLDELAKARECLLSVESKGAYDRELRNKDAPKLTSAGGSRRPARPDAPRRPRWSSDPAPVAVESSPAAATQPFTAPTYQTAPIAHVPVSVPVPAAAAYLVARPRTAPLLQNPLVLVGVAVVLMLFFGMIALAALIWGGSLIMARLPSGDLKAPDLMPSTPTPGGGAKVSGAIVTLSGIDAGGEKGAGRTLSLMVGEPVDVLSSYDPSKQRPPARVIQNSDGCTISGEGICEVLAFPVEVPSEYLLETTVTLRGKSNGVVQGLSAGGKQCQITIDGFDIERDGRGMRTALEIIDGRRPHDAADYPCVEFGSLLSLDRPAELRYIVLKDRIVMECNGRIVLDWTGGLERVSPNGMFARGGPKNLFWGTWQTHCRLSKCVFRPVLEVK